ncbi:carboxylating nicotinate-nucleotide diphosphorylase [Belliella aquatica]|uniref:nicotinate-nucleotide diphosphorylase (carboxylating) n=1 Tax=Belliella aquatica TaxID=1323734 RepID=A0ABQ1LV35_9BACT|nr:carboxylating nicotinate-nucleotide diphosphorylase [Belliella aquatica]MCH7404448.1 carboxylating nicotinate-nucleotide diphosphorylase [Belliella aquatica]GGC28150.1 nicotinate-nucleotide diphosphorylase (carboxylating) [Belliella aquatica]
MRNLPYLTDSSIQKFIENALLEDVGPGDYSSLSSIPAHQQGHAQLLIKEDGVIAGLELAEMIFKQFDPTLEVERISKDGDLVKTGDIGLRVKGNAISILTTERLVLNCMQRMSGIATKTHQLNKLISHTKAKLMDTRKTTPNFRMMEKWAVVLGGGINHRFALYDMVMLKDNHVDFAGGIEKAILATKSYLQANQLNLKIEVETRNLEEVAEVLRVGGIDYIMLDNMDYPTMRKAVEMVNGQFPLEASGGITEDTLKDVAECGVDFISVGALTHQVKSMDISLKAIN